MDDIVSHMNESYAKVQIKAIAYKAFEEEKLANYLKYLKKNHGIEACAGFYKYCIAVRAQFFFVQAIYLTYLGNIDHVSQEFKKYNQFHCKLTEQLGWLDTKNETKLAFSEEGETGLHVATREGNISKVTFYLQNLEDKKISNDSEHVLHVFLKYIVIK